jgi:RNA polymerase sigma-70 factor (ECF subfamily)
MGSSSSFEALLGQLAGGQDAAAAEIFRRYASRLLALARSRLDPAVLQKTDPEDVLQSVFRSFLGRYPDAPWQLHGWEGLWRLLALLTVRKCCRQAAYYRAEQRDVRREAPPPGHAPESSAAWEVVSREPTPAQAAVLAEALEEVLRGLEPQARQVVALSLQGAETKQIAVALGCSRRTVQRTLLHVEKLLERRCHDE